MSWSGACVLQAVHKLSSVEKSVRIWVARFHVMQVPCVSWGWPPTQEEKVPQEEESGFVDHWKRQGLRVEFDSMINVVHAYALCTSVYTNKNN